MADNLSQRGLPRGPFITIIVIAVLFGIRYLAIGYFGQLPAGYDYSVRYNKKSETVHVFYNRHKSAFNPVGIAVEAWEIEKMVLADIGEKKVLEGVRLPRPYRMIMRIPLGKSALIITGYSSGVSNSFPEYWALKNQFEWEEGQ